MASPDCDEHLRLIDDILLDFPLPDPSLLLPAPPPAKRAKQADSSRKKPKSVSGHALAQPAATPFESATSVGPPSENGEKTEGDTTDSESSIELGEAAGLSSDKTHEKIVLEYMRLQNRPYNFQNVFDNLRGAVPKTVVARILDSLSEPGDTPGADPPPLVRKIYGKAKVYMIRQGPAETAAEPLVADTGAEELEKLRAEVAELRKEVNRRPYATATIAEIRERIEKLQAMISADEERHSNSEDGMTPETEDVCCSPELLKEYQDLHARWFNLRGECNGLVESIAIAMELDCKTVRQLFDLETDEDVGLHLKKV